MPSERGDEILAAMELLLETLMSTTLTARERNAALACALTFGRGSLRGAAETEVQSDIVIAMMCELGICGCPGQFELRGVAVGNA